MVDGSVRRDGVPAGIESIYNFMFFKYYFLFSLLGTIMDTIRP